SAFLLGAVVAAGLLAVLHAGGVEGAADDLVAHAGQVADPTAAHEHHRVLLEVVALTGDVGGDLDAAGEADAGDLAQSRVRLLRGEGVHARADTAALGRTLEGGRLALGGLALPSLADQLLDGGQRVTSSALLRTLARARSATGPVGHAKGPPHPASTPGPMPTTRTRRGPPLRAALDRSRWSDVSRRDRRRSAPRRQPGWWRRPHPRRPR